MKTSKNEKLLANFTAYCKMYPEQRFWQALRNWAGASFLGVSDGIPVEDEKVNWNDTFYSDNQNGK